ncbi:MAG: hypothetical protein AB7S78_12130 [Candidatus Omnitrophota bacterium]
MTILYALLILSACFYILIRSRWIWSLNQARRKGIFPEKGKATMFDVRRLIIEGELDLAVEVYRWIFKTPRQKARADVSELAESIYHKNMEHE